MHRVLAISLDGFDVRLADEWQLPNLTALRSESATATLHSGTAHLTGLTGEHLATGLDPVASGRASAVQFAPETYACTQVGSSGAPVFGAVPTVVFDPCYFQLSVAGPEVVGITDWGAHDPGEPATARPADLFAEVKQRFGPYPARQWMYATPWASPAECAQMAADLTEAVHRRSEIAAWLLSERLPDWRLGIVCVSEAHSATEGLYHGVDPAAHWRSCPSREAAAAGLRSVYMAIDQLVGDLVAQFGDDLHVVFSLHGMGANSSDVPSMLLLGELLARWSGRSTPDLSFPVNADGLPLLPDGVPWGAAIADAIDPARGVQRLVSRTSRHLPAPALRRLQAIRSAITRGRSVQPGPGSLDWMPLMRHQPHWSAMRAFAIPSFYDGSVRVNVRGREASGCVDPSDYHQVLDELEALLRSCRDPVSGAPATAGFQRPFDDPMSAGPSDADLVIEWGEDIFGFAHPGLGTIGPVPPRRTGGHSSPLGRCLVHGPGVVVADLGLGSSFDVVPTLLDLSGSPAPWPMSGQPLPVEFASP